MLLLHGRVVGLGRALMKYGRPRVVDGGPVVLGAVTVRLLALLARMRVLWRIVDIVVRT